jgi:TrmH family RNA methyltransferase
MKFTVVLVRPKNPENIGLVARNMRNTGFDKLRLVGVSGVGQKSYVTAVHARDILESVRFYSDVSEATADLDITFASTSKTRKNFPSVSLKDAVEEMFQFPASTKIGLLFGSERIGLTSDELRSSNFRFMIPQATRQPSYNLASAVLLTLFHIFAYDNFKEVETTREKPLSRKEQEECIGLILRKLEQKNFIHNTNKRHMTEMIYDLFGRFALTSKDRKLLLAIFSKAVNR